MRREHQQQQHFKMGTAAKKEKKEKSKKHKHKHDEKASAAQDQKKVAKKAAKEAAKEAAKQQQARQPPTAAAAGGSSSPDSSSSEDVDMTQQPPPAAAAAAASPQLRVRLGEASQGVLQQVLGCWEWGAAVRAACDDNSSGREASSAPAPVCSPAGTVAPAAAAGDGGGASWMGSLRWLAGRRAAAPTAAALSASSQAVRPQQPQQHAVQGDVAAAAAFDWPQLLSALQQAGQSAGACVRMLQQQSCVPPAAYLCPISHEVMSDPVVACDGHTYERRAITEWLQACAGRRAPTKSPMTLLPMQPGLVPNHSLRSLIREWQEQQQQQA